MSERSERRHFVPDGWHTVTPRIVAHEAQELIAFVKYVFSASGDYQQDMPATLRVGDSIIMISDAGIRRPLLPCCTSMSTTPMRRTSAPSRLAPNRWKRPRTFRMVTVAPRCRTGGAIPGKLPRILDHLPTNPHRRPRDRRRSHSCGRQL